MKTIGIIGGLGSEATVDYYKRIIKQVQVINGIKSLDYPEILIYSVNMANFIAMLEKGDMNGAANYIASAINKLADAGAEFAAISANTPHLLFNQIKSQVSLPLISIVEVCKNTAKEKELKRCGLMGTRFTMKANFYSEVFSPSNIEIIVPNEKEIELINNLLFNELELGIFKDETRETLLQIVKRMIKQEQIDSLILGCTEFPLLFTDERYLEIPFINTSQIHIEEIVKQSIYNQQINF